MAIIEWIFAIFRNLSPLYHEIILSYFFAISIIPLLGPRVIVNKLIPMILVF